MGYLIQQLSRIWEQVIGAVGLHLAVSLGGVFFFGFPVSFSLAAYAVGIAGREGVALHVALPVAILVAALVGALFAALYTRVSMDSFAVITVAAVLANEALLRSWDSVTGGVLGIAGVSRPEFARSAVELMVLQAIVALCVLAAEWVLLRTPFGRSLRALREGDATLASSGVSPHRVGVVLILMAAVLSGVSGIFIAWRIQFLDPGLGGIPFLIQGLSVAILALRPQLRAVLLATVFVVLLPELLRFFSIPSSILGHARLLLYAVLLMALVVRLNTRTLQRRAV